jgi:hypothetical protein
LQAVTGGRDRLHVNAQLLAIVGDGSPVGRPPAYPLTAPESSMNPNGVSPAASPPRRRGGHDLLAHPRVPVALGLAAGVVARKRALDRLACLAAYGIAVDARRPRRREAVLAEAEAEEVPHARAERDEVALVRVAVLEAQVMERLEQMPATPSVAMSAASARA